MRDGNRRCECCCETSRQLAHLILHRHALGERPEADGEAGAWQEGGGAQWDEGRRREVYGQARPPAGQAAAEGAVMPPAGAVVQAPLLRCLRW